MPGHKQHELFGIGLWVFFLVLVFLNFTLNNKTLLYTGLVGFCFTFLGSIFPDIDSKSSVMFKHTRFFVGVTSFVVTFAMLAPWMQRTTEGALMMIGVCALVTIGALAILYAVIPPHRKAMHSISAGVVYAIVALACSFVLLQHLLISGIVAVFSFISFGSHLLLDKR